MKKFAFMMIASMAMAMTLSLTSCFDKNNNAEGGDSLSGDSIAAQVEDSINTPEAQAEEVLAETDSTESAE